LWQASALLRVSPSYTTVEWGFETIRPIFAGDIPQHTFLQEGVSGDHIIAIACLQDLLILVQMP
jgi:hypothetical protein